MLVGKLARAKGYSASLLELCFISPSLQPYRAGKTARPTEQRRAKPGEKMS
jgi:hypothetical protein